jgi:hypothetical protein
VKRDVRSNTVAVPRWLVTSVVVVALVGLALVGLAAVGRATETRTVATDQQVAAQQAAAERDVERAYEQATAQVRKVRALNLAISASQADAIAGKALSDLRALRHSALVSLGQLVGRSGGDADAYATTVEQRFDGAPVSTGPSPSPVLLAPRFYAIVTTMSELAAKLSDQATAQLTASPQSPSPSPTAPASSTPRPSASPSPSRP